MINLKQFQAIFGCAVDAIILFDETGRVLDFNAAAGQLFGYKGRGFSNVIINQILPDIQPDKLIEIANEYNNMVDKQHGLHRDGSDLLLNIRYHSYFYQSNKHVLLQIEYPSEGMIPLHGPKGYIELLKSIAITQTSSIDIAGLLKTIADLLAHTLNLQEVVLATFNRERRLLTHYIRSGHADKPHSQPMFNEILQSPGGWILYLLQPDLLQWEDPQNVHTTQIDRKKWNRRSVLSLPMVFRDQIHGMLIVSGQRDRTSYNRDEVGLLKAVANQAAMSVEYARLSRNEIQHRKQAQTLREITRIPSYEFDQERVLELILDQLANVIPYDSASIMLTEMDKLAIAAHRKLRMSDTAIKTLRFDLLPHVRSVLEKRAAFIIPDTVDDPGWKREKNSDHIRCWLGVPLIGRDRVIGLLNLDKEQPGFYSQEHADLALIFANQAAIAIENARLYTTERQRGEQLDALQATITDISAEHELPKLLQAILERAITLLDATGGDLGLYDETRNEIRIAASYNLGKDYTGTVLSAGEGAMGMAIQSRQAVTVNQYASWERALPEYKNSLLQAGLAVPIMIGNRILGGIGVADAHQERRFSSSDEHLLSLFAQHAAIAVENANLYETARAAAEKRTTLHFVSQQIVTANLNPDEIYQAIHSAAAQIMPAEAFVITEIDESDAMIKAVYLIDRGERLPSQITPHGSGLSGRVIGAGQPIYIADLLDETDGEYLVHFGSTDTVRSVLAVPMRLRGRVIGMLSTQSYRPDAFTADDQYLLEMLASYAAIALDNAKLFIHIQQLAITDSVTGIFNRHHSMELAQREFHRARRFNRPLTIQMLDIDHFKIINDAYGHTVGDRVLYQIAQVMKSCIRDIDILGRYGGEEFIIILPETEQASAQEVAERIRKMVMDKSANLTERSLQITISVGIAEFAEDVSELIVLIERADMALYAAKNSGRNRVQVFSSNPPPQQINIASPKE